MTIQEMIESKKKMGMTNQQVSELSGVPLGTVQKVFSGQTPSPRYKTLQALEKVFRLALKQDVSYEEILSAVSEGKRLIKSGEQSGPEKKSGSASKSGLESNFESNIESGAESDFESGSDFSASELHEAEPAYQAFRSGEFPGEKGENTLEDYLALPDERRVEMIDGVFYDMSAPTSLHQLIAGKLYTILAIHVAQHGGPCIPFIAPTDVQLDAFLESPDKTIVEPDVFVVCDRSRITLHRILGAPDLVMEVLSPGSWYHDMVRKLKKYKNAGVREYWIILPDQSRVLVYWFEEGSEPTEYTFEDRVPVRIWDGACMVDFREVEDAIHFLRKLRE